MRCTSVSGATRFSLTATGSTYDDTLRQSRQALDYVAQKPWIEMHVESLPIHGALIVVPQTFGDQRGYFKEVFSVPRYEKIGITEAFVQDNISVSNRGVL